MWRTDSTFHNNIYSGHCLFICGISLSLFFSLFQYSQPKGALHDGGGVGSFWSQGVWFCWLPIFSSRNSFVWILDLWYIHLHQFLSGITLGPTDLDGFVVGFGFMAFGGAGLHISMMHISNLWPEGKLVIITCLNGSFAMSAYVFLIFRVCEFIYLSEF